jgi:hypothetical protein
MRCAEQCITRHLRHPPAAPPDGATPGGSGGRETATRTKDSTPRLALILCGEICAEFFMFAILFLVCSQFCGRVWWWVNYGEGRVEMKRIMLSFVLLRCGQKMRG